jgi:flagellar basal-body rod protein FlgB
VNLPEIPLLSMLKGSMSWLEARQSVLSQNVSNADTPNYVARDVKPVDFEQMLRQNAEGDKFHHGLTTTDARHIAITPSSPGQFDSTDSPDIEAAPNGNSVSLEEEMIKVSQTQAQFQAATNLYSKALSMMRTAIGKSGP